MHCLALLQRRAQRPVQAVLQVQLIAPHHHVREQVTVEGRILFEQRVKIKGALGGHQLVEAHLLRGHRGPIALCVAMIGIGPSVSDTFEDHPCILTGTLRRCLRAAKYPGNSQGVGGSAPPAGWWSRLGVQVSGSGMAAVRGCPVGSTRAR